MSSGLLWSPEAPGSKFKSRRTLLIMLQTSNNFPDFQTPHLTSSPLCLCDHSQLPPVLLLLTQRGGISVQQPYFSFISQTYSIAAGWGRKCSQKQSSTKKGSSLQWRQRWVCRRASSPRPSAAKGIHEPCPSHPGLTVACATFYCWRLNKEAVQRPKVSTAKKYL